MILAIQKSSYIFKYSIFWYYFVDLSSLVKNLYKNPILAQVKKSQKRF